MITGDDIQAAEKRLRRINRAVPFPQGQVSIARVDQDAAHAFTQHHMDSMQQKFPTMPEDAKVAMRTFFFHMFTVGCICGRADGGRS